jgi:hypothetical protein
MVDGLSKGEPVAIITAVAIVVAVAAVVYFKVIRKPA